MRTLAIAPGLRLPAAAGAIALAVDVLYLALLAGQGDSTGSREAFVSATLAAVAAACFGSPLLGPRLRSAALAGAGTTLAVWGFLAILSIGFLLLPAAFLALKALAGALHGREDAVAALGGAVAAVLVVAVGLAWTS